MNRAQMSIEFFLIAGFILLAASVLISSSDQQLQETSALSSVVASRNALDLEVANARYAYYAGNNTVLSHISFIPANTTCFFFNASATSGKFFCVTSGISGIINSESVGLPDSPSYPFSINGTAGNECQQYAVPGGFAPSGGFLRITNRNRNGVIYYDCRRV